MSERTREFWAETRLENLHAGESLARVESSSLPLRERDMIVIDVGLRNIRHWTCHLWQTYCKLSSRSFEKI